MSNMSLSVKWLFKSITQRVFKKCQLLLKPLEEIQKQEAVTTPLLQIEPICAVSVDEPLTPVDNWKTHSLKEFLTEKGLTRLPQNPIEISDYSIWLKKKGYKPTSIAAQLVPVRKLYRVMGINTNGIIKGPKQSATFLKDSISEENIKKLLKYVDDKGNLRDRVIVRLMLYLGIGDLEVSRMDFGDFYDVDDKWIVKLWRKKHESKDVQKTVSNGLLDVFLQYREERSQILLQAGPITGDEPMFIGRKKHRLRRDVVSQIVSKLMTDAGIKTPENSDRITPYSLRLSAIAKMAKLTGDPLKIQQFGDLTDMKMVKRYIHHDESTETLIDWEG